MAIKIILADEANASELGEVLMISFQQTTAYWHSWDDRSCQIDPEDKAFQASVSALVREGRVMIALDEITDTVLAYMVFEVFDALIHVNALEFASKLDDDDDGVYFLTRPETLYDLMFTELHEHYKAVLAIRINLCSQVANERLLRQGGWQLAGLADPLNAKAGSLQMLKVMDMLPWPCRVYDQICDGLVLGLTDPKTTLFQFYPIEVLEGGYQLRSPLRVRAKKNSAISLFHDRRLIWRGALDHAFEHTIFEGQRAILTSVIPKAFCDAGAAVRTYCEPVKRWSQLCKLTWLNDVRVGFSEPGDIAALSLCVACYLKKDFLAKAKPQEHFYRHLASIETSFNNAQGMVLYDGDTLLGFLTWRLFDGLICHIDVVEVASAYQNQGVLSHMLNLLKKHFPSIAFFEFMPNDATIEAYRASNAWERVSSPGGVVFVNFSAHQADDCSSAPMALEARLCISPAPAFGRGLFYRNSAVKQYPIIVEKGGYLTTPLLLKLMPNTRVSLCLGPKTFVVEKAQELLAHGDYSVGRSGWMVIKAIRGGDKREINADVQNWIKAAMTGKKPPKPSMIAAIARLGIARANLARRTVDEAYEGGAPGPSNRRPRL